MSPHAVAQHCLGSDDELASFNVTRNGFLPSKSPLRFLPNAYYEPWELLIHSLSGLLANGTLRERIDRMPVLSTGQLTTEPEWRRAYSILTLLTHSYVWGGEKAAEILPPSISVPLLAASAHLELPPVATYAALNLWNFTSSNADFTDLDSLRSPHTFTGTESESWFLCVSVAMEAQGAHVIPTMLNAMRAIPGRDYDTIAAALDELSRCIRKVEAVLGRMRERCDPAVFYHRVRPFLAGSRNMAAAGLPRGLFYDEGGGRGSWREWRGGSNGQSSLVQFWDVVLGVAHAGAGSSSPQAGPGPGAPAGKSFHEEAREYMPGGHRRFLEHCTRLGSIRSLALQPTSSAGHQRMQEAYAAAAGALAGFRTSHVGIVTTYIIIPSKKPFPFESNENKAVNLATMSTRQQSEKKDGDDSADKELTGTGGTALLPFLKQARDETREASDQVKKGLRVKA